MSQEVFRSPAEAYAYLDRQINFEKSLHLVARNEIKLSRVRDALAHLGNPQDSYKIAHVTGTKGKGSVCAYLASLLTASGMKTGLYTSPHVLGLRERIKLDGDEVDEPRFLGAMNDILPTLEKFAADGRALTYFEILTALAFHWYRKEDVDYAVIEVGIGGKLDATNLVKPSVTAITNVGLDHTKILGETVLEIARDKVGIIKPGIPVVTAQAEESGVLEIIEAASIAAGARLYKLGTDFSVRSELRAHCFELDLGPYGVSKIELRNLGFHQGVNAATALLMFRLLAGRNPELASTAEPLLLRALSETAVPGRIEILANGPPVLIADVCHNEPSSLALANTLRSEFPGRRVAFVVSVLKDKDVGGIFRNLAKVADSIIVTKIADERAFDVETLIATAKAHFPASIAVEDQKLAVRRAIDSGADIVVVCGSFYLVGALYEFLRTISQE
ncbi:MAG: bifunctional folylpolyglutamate synthase/dihydrofolate synthase [Planctomycetes bacterium]|nr:bifunctional folylpolyglutamate synthase/dihydrofolate synthase [Planctomycetota bacterium]